MKYQPPTEPFDPNLSPTELRTALAAEFRKFLASLSEDERRRYLEDVGTPITPPPPLEFPSR